MRFPKIDTDHRELKEVFDWSVVKAHEYVATDRIFPIDHTDRVAKSIPCYWAGYRTRHAFYIRDFVHQADGAWLLGLDEENYRMMEAFVRSATKERGYFALWALCFDGSPYYGDYKSDDSFVREIPSQFELVECIYKLYLKTGDKRYLSDEMFDFCTRMVTTFVETLDTDKNGVPEGLGHHESISCTYDERGDEEDAYFEAGDGIGCQYQAYLAYAGLCKARGDCRSYEIWMDKAEELKRYFNDEWSVVNGDKDSTFAHAILMKDKSKKLQGFAKETSVFMPLKLVTEAGKRTSAYLDLINAGQGTGIGFPGANSNIEGYTYYPDLYFLYNRVDDAWKWMRYIMDHRHDPHESPRQGPNCYYPELSYTFVSHVVQGLMGVSVNVPDNSITTLSKLPNDIRYLNLKEQKMGNNTVTIMHFGRQYSSLSNLEGEDITWNIQFEGIHDHIAVDIDGFDGECEVKYINGAPVTCITVTVKANHTVTAHV
ncbi:MAG: hypothetical protein E7312_02560 [Clostridiales bacterium]|nr:hypothetical protein [Clostridiales bacterium]